jgi:hypothetical protein
MKIQYVLLIALFCFSFRPSTEKAESNTSNGFYVVVENHADRTFHKYIVESKDSVNSIFNHFFESELELGDVDRPISIYNGRLDFYIARVMVFVQPNGKKNFRHLKYPSVYTKRSKLKPVTL